MIQHALRKDAMHVQAAEHGRQQRVVQQCFCVCANAGLDSNTLASRCGCERLLICFNACWKDYVRGAPDHRNLSHLTHAAPVQQQARHQVAAHRPQHLTHPHPRVGPRTRQRLEGARGPHTPRRHGRAARPCSSGRRVCDMSHV